MAMPSEFLIIVGSYVGVFLLATLVFNFLMAGFLKTYLVVKGSRGAKVLVQVVTVARNYYRTGHIEDGFLVYKDANKHEKRLSIPLGMNVFYRTLNITCVTMDEETNVIILPNGHEVQGFDAEKYNNLYLRTLYRPQILDPKQQIMLLLCVFTFILSLVTIAILMFVIKKQITAIQIDVASIKSVAINSTII